MAQYTEGAAWFTNASDIVRGVWHCVAAGIVGAYPTDQVLTCAPSGATIMLTAHPSGGVARFRRVTGTPISGDVASGGGFSFTISTPVLDQAWLSNVTPTSVGPILTHKQTNWWQPIIAVLADDQVQVASPYSLTTARDAEYVIHPDFTVRHDLPLIGARDLQVAALLNRLLATVDLRLNSVRPVAKSASFSVLRTDIGVVFLVDAVSGIRTITLPLAATVGSGFCFRVMKTAGVNNITISRSGADLINGGTSSTINGANPSYELYTVFTDGVNWFRGTN
jgi:hypothetical protein